MIKFFTTKAFIVIIVIFVLICTIWIGIYTVDLSHKDFSLGVDFSVKQARSLFLNWQEVYIAMLDDLEVKKIRIHAPWNLVEPEMGEYDFSDLDWQIEEAAKRDVEIILAIGRRTPRWPECHDPEWIEKMSEEIVFERQLDIVEKVVNRYKYNNTIVMWQVENEPLLDAFGECPPGNYSNLRKEVSLVRTLDDRPILITDSGELGLWVLAANSGDYFGTTIYKVTYNNVLGYYYYHLPPLFYRLKAWLVGKDLDNVFISELQAEPWAEDGFRITPLKDQYISMDKERLVSHIEFARKTGFKAAYLWGVEWWYWLKETKGQLEIWQTAKEYLNQYK